MSEPPRGTLRIVVDTNVLVSAAVSPRGKPRRAVDLVIRGGELVFTGAAYGELVEVLARPRLRRYLPEGGAEGLLDRIAPVASYVDVAEPIRACRDPKDDKFLEAAVSGGAGFIVSGDEDLLVLDPFRGVRILTPAAFLAAMGEGGTGAG